MISRRYNDRYNYVIYTNNGITTVTVYDSGIHKHVSRVYNTYTDTRFICDSNYRTLEIESMIRELDVLRT